MSPLISRPPFLRPFRVGSSDLRHLAVGLACLMLWSGPVPLVAEETIAAAGRKTQAPAAVRRVSPVHPPELVKQLVNGEAVLECLIDEKGEVHDIKVVSESHAGFGAAAEDALRRWEFNAGSVNDQPRAMRVKVPFEFRLSNEQVLGVVAGRPVFAEITEPIIPAQQMPSWPRPIQFFTPRYPAELEGTGKYGKAVVNITIDTEGKVMNPRLVKATYQEFVVPALATALQLRFPPQVMADGRTIHVSMDIQFDFKPPSGRKAPKLNRRRSSSFAGAVSF